MNSSEINLHRTANVLTPEQYEARQTTPAQRQFLIDDAVARYCRENPGKSRDDGFAAVMAAPEMQPVVSAMRTPNVTPAATTDEAMLAARKKAGAKFMGLVKQAQHSRGISYDAAFSTIKQEEAELFAEMGPEPTKTWAEDARPAWYRPTDMQTQG